MYTIIALIEIALGFVPFIATALLITVTLWAAAKLFPRFDAWMQEKLDRMDGVDAEYDEKYETGYASTRFDQYV